MEVSIINLLDTLTNAIFLMVAILPIYIIGLSLVIGDVVIPAFHPMVKVSRNGSLRIMSIRHPLTNAFLFSITTSHKMAHLQPVASPARTFGNPYRYAMGAIAIMALVACNPADVVNNPVMDNGDKVSTKYVQGGYYGKKSCWIPVNQERDSLIVETRKYVVSDRSRYRRAMLPSALIDVLIEGDVTINDWAFYRDTKADDSIFVFNRCDYPANELGGN